MMIYSCNSNIQEAEAGIQSYPGNIARPCLHSLFPFPFLPLSLLPSFPFKCLLKNYILKLEEEGVFLKEQKEVDGEVLLVQGRESIGEGESYLPAGAVWRKQPRPFHLQCSGLRFDAKPLDLEFVLHDVLPLKPRNEV